MNYIIIKNNRYNLTDDGVTVGNGIMLTMLAGGYDFETVKKDFESVSNIEIYGTSEPEDFVSGFFENLTLKSVEYDIKDELYTVTMTAIDETMQRINDLEDAVNYLLMGGEE